MNIIPLEKKESLYIGDKIQVIVRRVHSSGEVELGIVAPKDTAIHREEFLNSLKKLKIQLSKIAE
jgi:carbon storage regulator CsrA